MSQIAGYLILAAALMGLTGTLFRPQWALVLVVTLYPVKQLIGAYLPVFVRISPLFNLLVFAAVILAVVSQIIRRERPTLGLGNGLTAVTWMLYFYATLALLWTPGNGVDRWLDGYPYWIMNVLLLPLALVRLEDFRRAIVPLLIVGAATAVLFYLNPNASWYSGRLSMYIAGRGTAEEIRGNPLAVGQMGGLIAVAAAMMLPARSSALVNLLRLAAILLGLSLAVTSGSRAQAVVAVLTIILFYPISRPVKNVNQFFLTAGGLGLMTAVIFITFKLFLGQTGEQSRRWDLTRWWDTIMSRAGEAAELVQAYIASPQSWLQGLGTNAFSAVSGIPISYAHNAAVEMLCELGLIGFGLYIVAVVLAFHYGRVLFRLYREDPVQRGAAAALLAASFYAFALSQKQYTFVAMPEPWWLWILMAKISTYEYRAMAALQWQTDNEAAMEEGTPEANQEAVLRPGVSG